MPRRLYSSRTPGTSSIEVLSWTTLLPPDRFLRIRVGVAGVGVVAEDTSLDVTVGDIGTTAAVGVNGLGIGVAVGMGSGGFVGVFVGRT